MGPADRRSSQEPDPAGQGVPEAEKDPKTLDQDMDDQEEEMHDSLATGVFEITTNEETAAQCRILEKPIEFFNVREEMGC